MKKIVLFFGAMLVYVFYNFAQQPVNPNIDPNDYVNTCIESNPSVDGVTEVYIWFNDPDGDCRSDDWYMEFHWTDGHWTWYNSDDEVPPIELDFGDNDCCWHAGGGNNSGGGTSDNDDDICVCDMYWVGSTLIADCTNCPTIED